VLLCIFIASPSRRPHRVHWHRHTPPSSRHRRRRVAMRRRRCRGAICAVVVAAPSRCLSASVGVVAPSCTVVVVALSRCCRRSLCCCAPSPPSVVRGVRASRDRHRVLVCNAWAVGPVDGVVGATAGVPCAWRSLLLSLRCAAVAVVGSRCERLGLAAQWTVVVVAARGAWRSASCACVRH
jgi:hypothetical protein